MAAKGFRLALMLLMGIALVAGWGWRTILLAGAPPLPTADDMVFLPGGEFSMGAAASAAGPSQGSITAEQ